MATRATVRRAKSVSISEGINNWESEGEVVYDRTTRTYFYKEGGSWKAMSEEYAKAKRMVDSFVASRLGSSGTSCLSSECSVTVGDEESVEVYHKPTPLTEEELRRLAVLRDFLAWVSDNPEVQYRLDLISFRYPWDD